METSVGIQDAYSYAAWPMFVLGGFIVFIILALVVITILKKYLKKKPKRAPKPVKEPQVGLLQLKAHCIADLDAISIDLVHERITLREAYQRTSVRVRKFVHDATRINVQNYTLEEIQGLHMPQLEELIRDYYSPEFAWKTDADFASSMERTKRLVETWK